ncbi:MAG: 4a-hydroxytetrahydrobiopterin dehydratase [Candidatus Micrarchaeota archaeon]|nr:4a-hydroxytetrahydrobiopterin dehydratase [Candidatus Micrarchaeota archaeon]
MRLSNLEVQEKLRTIRNWQIANGKLHKEFKFDSFEQAIGFIDNLAQIATSLNHHPEIQNVYNKVALDIATHDEGGITELDFVLAKRIDSISGNL